MTKSEIFNTAHIEARKIVAAKCISYAEAFKYGLRRVYNKIQSEAYIADQLKQHETPKFMFLRGMR